MQAKPCPPINFYAITLLLATMAIALLIYPGILIPRALAKTIQDTKGPQKPAKESEIRWEDGILSVAIKDAPVKEVLQEISRKAGFELITLGDFNQHIAISFSRPSLEKGLGVIMDVAELNFITILGPNDTSLDQAWPRIKKLIVIASGGGAVDNATIGRHSTLERQPMLVGREKPEPGPQRRQPVPQRSKTNPTPRTHWPQASDASSRGIFEGSGEDLDDYLAELVSEERLSADEYQMIQENITRRGAIQK
jgi:hypothetical protein